MGIDADMTGRLLSLPPATAAGESTALRGEVLDRLRLHRVALVEDMAVAVRRAGQAPLLEVGGEALERRLDQAALLALAAWEDCRPLRSPELDALRRVGAAVARSGIPLWRVLGAVQLAARAGWDHVVAQALAVVEDSRRPRLAAHVIAGLSADALEVVGRIEAEIAGGHGEAVAEQRPATRLPARALAGPGTPPIA
jgi:hypothetical protein